MLDLKKKLVAIEIDSGNQKNCEKINDIQILSNFLVQTNSFTSSSGSNSNSSMSSPKDPSTEKFITTCVTKHKKM